MPSAKKEKQPEPIENIQVKLKLFMGMSPRLYVPITWITLILVLVFLFLVLPGVRKNGTYLTVNTIPADAEIILGDVRLGPSGSESFAISGENELVVRKAGYYDYSESRQIKGRIFASRIFHRKERVDITLQVLPGYDPLAESFREFSSWAATGPEVGRYAIPSSLTEGAREVSDATLSSSPLVKSALASSIDERHLADIFRSEAILSAESGFTTFSSLETLVLNTSRLMDSNPTLVAAIASMIDPVRLEQNNLGRLSSDISMLQTQVSESFADYYTGASRTVIVTYGGFRFIVFPGQNAPVGDFEILADGGNIRSGAAPAFFEMESFAIASREVSNSEFDIFVKEAPEWGLENRDKLILEGLADETYLDDWSIAGPAPGTAKQPVTGVSWHAASAYSEWFSERFLNGSGYIARLPEEAEWETAARWNDSAQSTADLPATLRNTDNADSGRLGILGMAGSVREWCNNPFLYNGPLFGEPSENSEYYAAMAIRGGAFIDPKLEYPVSVRGSLPPQTASPVVGFRLALE